MTKTLTAIVNRENDGYVALCPELDIASHAMYTVSRVIQAGMLG